ncbi:hypothetical protein ACODYM_29175 [Burkholderia gladioli]|uniref:hypothetical protein n=1 Tax=Burkholderia gladioli TaxID=28095 RepID=UPI003B500051
MKQFVQAHYRGIPSHVKVGNFKFTIDLRSRAVGDLAHMFGACDTQTQVIWLFEGMTPENLADTFIHEVLHAIHWVADLDDKSDEEAFTLRTAHGLCQLWQDNPETMKWWTRINGRETA